MTTDFSSQSFFLSLSGVVLRIPSFSFSGQLKEVFSVKGSVVCFFASSFFFVSFSFSFRGQLKGVFSVKGSVCLF